MKFLALVFAIILVVQLAGVTADKMPFSDAIEAYEEQQYIDNNDIRIATGDMSSLSRRCTISLCTTLCRSRGFRRGVCISATLCRCFR
ncbi:unnamed protein product [Arctia plantaginis]|uniref:Uncharacterized protein n=2 Tax=Arctia plantaginis TaxID=874455 RepID=A0A8S1B4W2_ARCPL|nr:unnamed protein product [Arctia plantaginis]